MTFSVVWTRIALKRLPPEARAEVERRICRLKRYFPEIRSQMKIGLTRSYDGLAFQSDDGSIKLMLDVRRRRGGGYAIPSHWTMAHELMHLAQFVQERIPSGERACDIHALARVPPPCIDEPPTYLVVPVNARRQWNRRHARLAHQLARRALEQRSKGLRRYAVWWEDEFENRLKS